jgi:hypothetical protein
MIHERFYYNRRYAAATSLRAECGTQAGGLVAQSVDILFKDAFLLRVSARPSHLAFQQFRHEPS